MITARSVFSLRSFHESFCVSFQVVTRFSASKKRHTHHHSGKGQILRPTPNTAPLICGACYNTQPEDLLTMA